MAPSQADRDEEEETFQFHLAIEDQIRLNLTRGGFVVIQASRPVRPAKENSKPIGKLG